MEICRCINSLLIFLATRDGDFESSALSTEITKNGLVKKGHCNTKRTNYLLCMYYVTALEVPVSCHQKNEQRVDASTDFHLNESFFNGFEM